MFEELKLLAVELVDQAVLGLEEDLQFGLLGNCEGLLRPEVEPQEIGRSVRGGQGLAGIDLGVRKGRVPVIASSGRWLYALGFSFLLFYLCKDE